MLGLLARRTAAYLVDIVLLFAVLFPAGLLVRYVVGWPGTAPTGPEIWLVSAVNFSLPVWAYFALADASPRGATVGKRLLGLRVVRLDGGRVGLPRAVGRTAVKVLPWEAAHASAFALMTDPAGLNAAQAVGLTLANGLAVAYYVVAAWTAGRRSVHDLVVATAVSG